MPKDKLGRELVVGQWVARATGKNWRPMEFRSVIKIDEDKVYLNSPYPTPLRNVGHIIIIAEPNDKLAQELEEGKYK